MAQYGFTPGTTCLRCLPPVQDAFAFAFAIVCAIAFAIVFPYAIARYYATRLMLAAYILERENRRLDAKGFPLLKIPDA